ncbi:MAG TPA: hypothetical protein VES66_04135, partial [Terriglobales bacterium]|nr:hypothetical protein [Terriglobales bacterium]
ILGGGILGGLLATMSGHLLNGGPFPRPIAAAMTVSLVGCSLVAHTLAKRKLRPFDRVALVGFLAAVMGGILKTTEVAGLIGLGIGFGCLLAAWANDRFSSAKSKPPVPNEHIQRPPTNRPTTV